MIERRSAVLKPSTLVCIDREPTINVTRGCAHRCTYCYARAYPEYPGDDRVQLYANLPEKLADELTRRRKMPGRVHFSSSSDCFGPYAEVQRATYRAMKVVLERGIPVAFLTKGYIRRPFYGLFRTHADLVDAQIGLITVHRPTARLVEPGAARPRLRLRTLRRLCRLGIPTSVRVDPIIPGLTDTPDQLRRLLSAIARCGARHVAASYLFLRPGIRRALERELHPPILRERVLRAYRAGRSIVHRANPDGAGITVLPAWRRQQGFERLHNLARQLGIRISVCTCKNTDLDAGDRCNAYRSDQLMLF
jgi:DNA repair photolyase